MRRLVTWDLMTLDGAFEGATPWALDFHERVWGEELEAFSLNQLEEVGTLLFGRRTYEGMAAHWATATGAVAERMNALDKCVATRQGTDVAWSNARILVGDIGDHVGALKAETAKKDIFVFGSAELTAALLAAGAVDEMRLFLVPTILGTGTPLFRQPGPRAEFDLLEARPFESGGVLLRYGRHGGGPG